MRESFSLEKVTLMRGILRRSLEEKVATLESLEDETQSGNGQDNFQRCSICWESSLSKANPKLCALLAETLALESQNKGTKRRDDIGSREDLRITTEFSHQEKTTSAKVRFPLHLIA